MIFVTSWDDGYPEDQRIAELLDRHGLSGTFYVPIRNSEGRPVMNVAALRGLDQHFEIGSHTLDHIYLPELKDAECIAQINEGKEQLENILGHDVRGFCFPGGKINRVARNAVKNAGFSYARGIDNFWLNRGFDQFNVPTTLQFYPHSSQTLWRNYISGRNYFQRFRAFSKAVSVADSINTIRMLAEEYSESDNVLHIWGHSWEVEKNNLWAQLDDLLKHVSSFHPQACSVQDLYSNTDKALS